ncbi:glycosyltransferase [Longimicrobium sp.]|uniref:glycosyltransferase n=1 Tax=Longimicrobium sp. TaxID=2029185 RepID=UPI002C888E9E|nr:glycosyltransferase [Longimicrobium sp.]HSU12891.1 glycosyltransferase [Longimicrobium sp.]
MIGSLLFGLAAVTAGFFVLLAGDLVAGVRQLVRLRDVLPLGDGEMPSVTIIAPARNEERGIEAALRSLLRMDVPRLEVIVVEDRSDDGTGAILDRMAAGEPRLKVVHVTELPAGWLGKNHALELGAARATGELLLFTDADVVMAPDTLRRAAAHLVRGGFDHVAAGPHVDMPGWLLRTFGVFFGIMFVVFTRPWKVKDPRSRHHAGVGAFNLVRAEAYRRIGGHRPIAMRPDDDVKLGKLVKKHGLRSDFASAADHVRVEWYHTVGEAVRGLRKNGFAGVDYRLSLILLATVTQLLFFIWPFIAVFVTHGVTRTLYGVAVAIVLCLFAGAAREQRVPMLYGLAVPLASILFIVVIWNATLYALMHRGIEWRGTHYPLDELRANRV